jgi:apolipoprotein N-acyltransferase
VGAVVLQDWLRTYVPFGGVPLGGVPLGQAAGPLVPAARLGGQLALTGVAAVAAVALELVVSTLARRDVGARSWRRAAELAVMFSVVVALPLAGALVPSGRAAGTMRVALVQGGGPRGLRAVETSAQRALDAQVAETAEVRGPVDLIVWPEDVVALPGRLAGSAEAAQVAAIARAHGAPVLAGVTEDVGADKFRNAMVEWSAGGAVIGRYDKVHRVPFGEYVPLRSLVQHVVSLDAIPRDAIPGHGNGELATPAGPVAITISYEVFFPDRARSAVRAGGQVLLVPTNTASYTTTQVSAAEVAALRIRAWSTGRDVAMVAPTGWSAVVDSHGRLLQRSRLGVPAVIEATLARRTGETPYVRWGDLPVVLAAAALLGAAWGAALRS